MMMRLAMAAVAALLGLVLAATPAHAQMRAPASGGMQTTATSGQGAGAGGGGGSGSGGGGGFGGGSHTLPTLTQVHYANPSAHGTEADYQPTSFMPYDAAVKMGQDALSGPQKTLGEIAAEYRAEKASRHAAAAR